MSARLNENERKVLSFLADDYHSDEKCFPFAPIIAATGLNRAVVRRACRSLSRKGFASFHRGLWTYDDGPGGSGYACTREGYEVARARGEQP